MGDATYSAEQIEQLLKCPVCLDRFNQPKILPCQHTFCKSPCLRGLITASNSRFIKCPECRAQHLLPREGIDGFATNITIAGFLDLQAQAPTASDSVQNNSGLGSPTCLGCGVCGAELDLTLCHHCDKRICDSCHQSHVRQVKLDVGRLVNHLRRKIPQVSDLVGQVEHRNEQVRSNVDSIRAEINNTIEKHTKELKDRQNTLNTELEILLQMELRSLRLHQENLEVELASVASFCDSTEGALSRDSSAPVTDLVAMRQQSSQLMEQCNQLEQLPLPHSRKFRWDYNGQNCTNTIMSLGDIAVANSGSNSNAQNGHSPPQAVPTLQRNQPENIAFIAPMYERGNSDMLMPLQRSPPRVYERRGQSSNAAMLRHSDSRVDHVSPSRNLLPPHLRNTHLSHSMGHPPTVLHRPPAVPSLIRTDNTLFTPPTRQAHEIRDDEERAFAGFISFSNPNFRGNRTRPQVIRGGTERRNNRRNRSQNNQTDNHRSEATDQGVAAAPSMSRREGTFTVDDVDNNNGQNNEARNSNGNGGPDVAGMSISFDLQLDGDEASGSANIDNAMNRNMEDQQRADGPVPVHDYRRKTRIFRRIGSRGNGNGKFTWPRGVAVAPNSDKIYVADSSNHRVQIFGKEGQFLKAFGSYGQNSGEFDCLAGIAVTRSSEIITSDRYNHRVQIFDADGNFIKQFGQEGQGDGQFSYPWGVCSDNSGFIYVCDKENHRIQKFQRDGTFVKKFGELGNGNGQFENPHYIAVNDETLVISDHGNHRIQVFNLDGNHKLSFGVEGSEPGQLKYPKGVAIDRQGFILIGNSGNNRIDVFRDDGRFFCSFGSIGQGNNLKSLEDIALMANGRVIACNRENHNITVY